MISWSLGPMESRGETNMGWSACRRSGSWEFAQHAGQRPGQLAGGSWLSTWELGYCCCAGADVVKQRGQFAAEPRSRNFLTDSRLLDDAGSADVF